MVAGLLPCLAIVELLGRNYAHAWQTYAPMNRIPSPSSVISLLPLLTVKVPFLNTSKVELYGLPLASVCTAPELEILAPRKVSVLVGEKPSYVVYGLKPVGKVR